MRSFRYVLVPALVAACQSNPGGATATEATATTDTDTDPTATGTTETSTGTPTTGNPDTTSTGTLTEGSATMATGETTAVDPTTAGPTTHDPSETTTDTTPDTTTDTTTDSTTDTGETTAVDSSSTDTTTDTTGRPGECSSGDTQDCYTGPPGTMGIGLCAAGQQTCGPDETWGPCDGEVLPAAESCDMAGDENCDGVDPCDGEGVHAWSLVAGGNLEDEGVRIAYDGAGNLVLAARTNGTIDLGGGPLAPKGAWDVLLAKYSPTGEHVWSKRFGDSSDQGNDSVRLAVSSAGDIVLTGEFKGIVDFGGGPLTNQSFDDAFLVEFDDDGNHVWSKAFEAGGYAYPQAIALDPSGNVLLGGLFTGTLDLGGGAMNSAGLADAFVGKFTSAGAHVWSVRYGDPNGQYVTGIAADGGGNVYITGGFQGVINPGNGQLVSSGAEDVFLVRLDPAGNAVWGKRFGNNASQIARGLAIDGDGRVTIVGEMGGSADFGGGPITTAQTYGFIAQFESDGSHVWSRMLGYAGGAQPAAVATDGVDNVLVTGYFVNICDFGGGPLTAEGNGDAFVVKLAPSGDHVWSKRFGDFEDQSGYGVAGSTSGNVAMSGRFRGGINLGAGPKTTKGGYDLFVAAFGP